MINEFTKRRLLDLSDTQLNEILTYSKEYIEDIMYIDDNHRCNSLEFVKYLKKRIDDIYLIEGKAMYDLLYLVGCTYEKDYESFWNDNIKYISDLKDLKYLINKGVTIKELNTYKSLNLI